MSARTIPASKGITAQAEIAKTVVTNGASKKTALSAFVGIITSLSTNFKRSAKDLLITSQLRAAIIGNKKIKSVNYNIDTYKKKIYVYGIAQNEVERDEITKEAKQILDVEDVITSIFLVDDLRVVKK